MLINVDCLVKRVRFDLIAVAPPHVKEGRGVFGVFGVVVDVILTGLKVKVVGWFYPNFG